MNPASINDSPPSVGQDKCRTASRGLTNARFSRFLREVGLDPRVGAVPRNEPHSGALRALAIGSWHRGAVDLSDDGTTLIDRVTVRLSPRGSVKRCCQSLIKPSVFLSVAYEPAGTFDRNSDVCVHAWIQ